MESPLSKRVLCKDSSGRPTNEVNTLPIMQAKTIVKFGIAALAMGSFFGVSLPVKADQPVWLGPSSWIILR